MNRTPTQPGEFRTDFNLKLILQLFRRNIKNSKFNHKYSAYTFKLFLLIPVLPDSSALRVVVEHPVPLLPDDVLGLLPHDVLHDALELDRGALVVENAVLNLLVPLIHNFYSWHWKVIPICKSILFVVASGFDGPERSCHSSHYTEADLNYHILKYKRIHRIALHMLSVVIFL